jgi:ParB family chromosome partitioning protein
VREGGVAEEDSLAENVQRAPLHPLDQFRAFLALREKGQSEEEIAATFFVSVQCRQAAAEARVGLAGKLLDVLRRGRPDASTSSWRSPSPAITPARSRCSSGLSRLLTTSSLHVIRRMADRGRGARRRQAGAVHRRRRLCRGWRLRCMRDLFQGDDGGWLQDVALLDPPDRREAGARKLPYCSRPRAGSGSRPRPTFPTATASACGSSAASPIPLTRRGTGHPRRPPGRVRSAWSAEYEERRPTCRMEIDARLGELETAHRRLCGTRPLAYVIRARSPAPAPSSAFTPKWSTCCVERGFVRPQDELPVEAGSSRG